MYPGIELLNLATDGATIGEVFGEQLPQLDESAEPMLVTLTIGGNDLLSAFGNRPRKELLARIAADVAEAYDFLVDLMRGRFPHATIVLTTVYDPSDGLARIPGVFDEVPELPMHVLDQLNDHIRDAGGGTPNVLLADVLPAFSRSRHVGGGIGSLVLATVADRAQRARRERDPTRLAGRPPRGRRAGRMNAIVPGRAGARKTTRGR